MLILRCTECGSRFSREYVELFVLGRTNCRNCNARLVPANRWVAIGRGSFVLNVVLTWAYALMPGAGHMLQGLMAAGTFIAFVLFITAFFMASVRQEPR